MEWPRARMVCRGCSYLSTDPVESGEAAMAMATSGRLICPHCESRDIAILEIFPKKPMETKEGKKKKRRRDRRRKRKPAALRGLRIPAAPPTIRHGSPKDYDRKKAKEVEDEET